MTVISTNISTNAEIDSIPGTIQLIDVNHNLRAHHARFDGSIVLSPEPSSDINDPLNWTPRRKLLALICQNLYTWSTGISVSLVYSVLVPLSQASGVSVAALNQGTGYMYLFLGWSLLFWQPLTIKYGKRLVYLVSVLGAIATTVWSAYIGSNGQWIAKCILQGFFVAPIEALPEMSTTDIYFTHERGMYMAIYAFSLAGSNYFAPVICGFIAEYQGWRWVFYWPSIFLAVVFVFVFLFMEETTYDRPVIAAVSDDEEMTSTTPPPDNNVKREESGIGSTVAVENAVPSSGGRNNAAPLRGKEKSFAQKLSIWHPSPGSAWLKRPVRTFRFFAWPVVVFAGFYYGCVLIWFNILNATASLILSEPPYSFKSSIVGLNYVSCCIGVIVGCAFTGRLSDWLIIRLARQNNGVMEAENRLWPLLLSTLMVPASLILWGVGASNHIHWIGLSVAMGCLAFTTAMGVTLSISYLIDSYHSISFDAIVPVIIIRNTMSFVVSYGITPWFTQLGVRNCFISAACIGLFISASFLIMIKWGKFCRVRGAAAYYQLLKEDRAQV